MSVGEMVFDQKTWNTFSLEQNVKVLPEKENKFLMFKTSVDSLTGQKTVLYILVWPYMKFILNNTLFNTLQYLIILNVTLHL